MVLAGTLPDTDEKLVAFLNERPDEWPLGLGKQGEERGDAGVSGQVKGLGQVALALSALAPRHPNGVALAVDGLDGFEERIRLVPDDLPLLRVEQGQQLAVLP